MLAVIQMMEGLVEAALDPEAPPHEVGDMAQFVVAALQKADAETMNALADLLAPAIDLHSPHAAVTFVLAGALVEAGADPLRVGPAVLAPLSTALEECAEFVTHHEADAATPPPAWMVLNLIWRPAVAVLGSSVDLRATHRGLRAAAMKIEKLHIGGEWLSILLRVLDDEPLLVIHAAQDRAFECRLSGTTTLYELQTLLQIELIGDPSDGWLGGTTPPNEIISCARGEGPPMCSVPGTWQFDLFQSSEGVQSSLHLPSGGSPDDVSLVGTRRVVWLDAAEARSYSAHRSFATMRPTLRVERKMKTREAQRLLEG